MRIALVGQKWLGAEALRLLLDRGDDVALVAAPAPEDAGDDRLASAGLAAGLNVVVCGRRLTADLMPAGCDLIVAAHAHAYITADARAATRMGALGYHPSLLPRHRGRDAVRWAIHMRESITGGTAYWMDDGADTGPIAAQGWCHIRPDDDPQTLWRRALAPLGIALLRSVLEDLDQGVVTRIPQDATLATWEPAFSSAKLGR